MTNLLLIAVLISQLFIHLKNKKMNENLQALNDKLDQTNALVGKVRTDVAALHAQITTITGGLPTQEEWDAIKTKADDLNSQLQVIDDQTPEEPGA